MNRAKKSEAKEIGEMSGVNFSVRAEAEYSIVSFDIEGIMSPEDLASLKPPKGEGSKGVILSGWGPIGLYCYLTHFYHPTKFIATHDPRLRGAVVVESHSPDYEIGSVIMTKK